MIGKNAIALAVLVALVLTAVPCAAKTMYVSDHVEIMMRRGKGLEFRIVEVLQSDQEVEVFEMGEQWAGVRLPGGETGYVLTRFLQEEVPCRLKLGKQAAALEKLGTRAEDLAGENANLRQENQELAARLEEQNRAAGRLAATLPGLDTGSTDFTAIGQAFDEMAEELERHRREARQAREELGELRRQQYLRWFLAGAGVLLFGLFLGLTFRSRKSRSGGLLR
ncbi:MAG: TIGR04211 family SH3 domain-containing protein [Desulfatibacillaceae bacterium]